MILFSELCWVAQEDWPVEVYQVQKQQEVLTDQDWTEYLHISSDLQLQKENENTDRTA